MAAVAALGTFGLVIGSFLNVVIYRVPLGRSIVSPASACGSCGHEIRAYDNIPLVSWVLLRGKCRDCAAPISVRYPLVELAVGVFFAVVAFRFVPVAPFSGLERDACRCWHESFQDFAISGRYRFGDEFWALAPQVRYITPSHDYPYQGEAVVGGNLHQLLMGVNAAWRLAQVLPKASVEAGYTFGLVETVVEGTRPNRSNVTMSFGYALTRALYVHGGALFTKTHSGLTAFEVGTAPPDQRVQADRLLKMRFWHLTGGISYSTGFADLFVAVEPYVWGRDTHDGIAYTAGATWYFDFSR